MRTSGDCGVHVRALAVRCAESVAHGVLHAQRDEVEALDGGLDRRDVDADGAAHVEELRPGQRARGVEDVVLGAVAGVPHLPQHAARDAALQVGGVAQREIARRRRPAVNRA